MIKGWVDEEGETREKNFDVAWAGTRKPDAAGKLPVVGYTVDLDKATCSNTLGSSELVSVWSDPTFDPAQSAFYFVRLLEIPSPGWTLYDKIRFGAEPDESVPLVHQERAFSSPIWYTPQG